MQDFVISTFALPHSLYTGSYVLVKPDLASVCMQAPMPLKTCSTKCSYVGSFANVSPAQPIFYMQAPICRCMPLFIVGYTIVNLSLPSIIYSILCHCKPSSIKCLYAGSSANVDPALPIVYMQAPMPL